MEYPPPAAPCCHGCLNHNSKNLLLLLSTSLPSSQNPPAAATMAEPAGVSETQVKNAQKLFVGAASGSQQQGSSGAAGAPSEAAQQRMQAYASGHCNTFWPCRRLLVRPGPAVGLKGCVSCPCRLPSGGGRPAGAALRRRWVVQDTCACLLRALALLTILCCLCGFWVVGVRCRLSGCARNLQVPWILLGIPATPHVQACDAPALLPAKPMGLQPASLGPAVAM